MPGTEKSQKVEDRVPPLRELTGYRHVTEQVTARPVGCAPNIGYTGHKRAVADSLRNDVEIRGTVKDGD